MFEEKESFWRKKGFYLATCTALICLLAVGTVYYKMNYEENSGGNLFADSATEAPTETGEAAGNSAVTAENTQNSSASDDQNASSDKSDETTQNKTKKDTSSKNSDSSSTKVTDTSKQTDKSSDSKSNKSSSSDNKSVTAMAGATNLKFDEEKGLLWPVGSSSDDVILKYSMSNTIYFKTLAQYKCNPAISISASAGTDVKAAATGIITKISKSDELGKTITMNIGSDYTVTYGQLKNINVKKGQEIKEGNVIGQVASPTKYYSEEGSNLYLQVKENGSSVDPLLLLR